MQKPLLVFKTPRLIIRKATTEREDLDMYFRLWNHPQVMVNVGYPNGLGISKEEIAELIRKQDDTVYRARLIAIRIEDNVKIGECFMGVPDENGVSITDVKLFPEYWGNGYGKEIKRGLVDYLFSNRSDCKAVKADPHKRNIASQKMQEFVGAVRIEKGGKYPIDDMEKYFPGDEHYLYMVFREKDK